MIEEVPTVTNQPAKPKLAKRGSKGLGQIVKRGDSKFLVRVFLGRNDATGKRSYHNQIIFGAKKDAERYLAEISS